MHARRAPRLPRRAARAHGRGGDARARGLPAAPAAELSDLLLTAALVHDLGKTREFTYGAEIGLTEEGRLLGHLVLGQRIVSERAGMLDERAPARAAALRALPPRADGAPGGRFASVEALALYRLNALDASVKGAFEHGLGLGSAPRSDTD